MIASPVRAVVAFRPNRLLYAFGLYLLEVFLSVIWIGIPAHALRISRSSTAWL